MCARNAPPQTCKAIRRNAHCRSMHSIMHIYARRMHGLSRSPCLHSLAALICSVTRVRAFVTDLSDTPARRTACDSRGAKGQAILLRLYGVLAVHIGNGVQSHHIACMSCRCATLWLSPWSLPRMLLHGSARGICQGICHGICRNVHLCLTCVTNGASVY